MTLKQQVSSFFLNASKDSLFTIYYAGDVENAKCIIHIPAFAEEMNKSRHMLTKQANVFVEQGVSVVIFDLWGTGDSQGEFAEATWARWLDNINAVVLWLKTQGYSSISLWGLRTGVLLALDFLLKSDDVFDKLLAWQPVLNGEQYAMQFLRLRAASSMMDKHAPQIKTSDLKQQLLNGKFVEVAGYLLNPALIEPMMQLKLGQADIANIAQCHIFELALDESAKASFLTDKWGKHLKQLGVRTTVDVLSDAQFWASQDIAESPGLLELSSLRLVEIVN